MGLPLEMSVCPVHTHAHVCELHVVYRKEEGCTVGGSGHLQRGRLAVGFQLYVLF